MTQTLNNSIVKVKDGFTGDGKREGESSVKFLNSSMHLCKKGLLNLLAVGDTKAYCLFFYCSEGSSSTRNF